MQLKTLKSSFSIIVALMVSSVSARADVHHSATEEAHEQRFVQIAAKTKEQRTEIANAGVSIEFVRSDSVWGFANADALQEVSAKGFQVMGNFDASVARGGHHGMDFPAKDSKFHNYAEMSAALRSMNSRHADISTVQSIGKSIEGRDILAIHINSSEDALMSGESNKPGLIIMGAHHAREHLSVEIPLMFAKHLLDNRENPNIANLLDSRDIWIIPMVNPDGAEYDISTGSYKSWRKNRRKNANGTFGVDLNRNYGFKWGTGGSSKDPSSDVFMGPSPFSEPESTAIRDFVSSHLNAKVLLSVHTFSELILYPWGHTYDDVGNTRDHQVFETMAQTMSKWNGYTPQQASDLYIASGDTTDWAYGQHGIFGFTFELSPSSMWDGGFYPGQGVIDRVFNANIQPMLYMLQVADDPYQVLNTTPSGWLQNYVAPALPASAFWSNQPQF